jgi:hypothetical protein
MTVPLLTGEDELAAVNVAVAVARGADNVRKLAAYFHVPVDDRTFHAALADALGADLIRFTDGCHFGGDHTLNCELETIR